MLENVLICTWYFVSGFLISYWLVVMVGKRHKNISNQLDCLKERNVIQSAALMDIKVSLGIILGRLNDTKAEDYPKARRLYIPQKVSPAHRKKRAGRPKKGNHYVPEGATLITKEDQ